MAALRFCLLALFLVTCGSAVAGPLFEKPFLVVEPGMHTAPINRIDVDAEGRFLVSASDDKTVRVWAVADGRLLRTIRMPAGPEHVGKAYAVAISPDGETIAAGGWTYGAKGRESIYLFERRSGRMVGRIGGLENVVLHLAFAADGGRLAATLGGGNGIRVYERGEAAEGEKSGWREVAADRDYGDHSYWAAFAGDGRLATTSYDGQVRLYASASGGGYGKPLLKKAPGGGRPFAIAWSPDGERLALGYDDSHRVDLLDGRSLEPLGEADTGDVAGGDLSKVTFSADGARLLAGGRFQRNGRRKPIRAWEEAGEGAAREVAVADNTIMDLRALTENRLAFAATDPRLGLLDGSLQEIWSNGPGKADYRGQMSNLAVSADGSRIRFGYEFWGREASLIDLTTRSLTHGPTAEALRDLAAPRQEAPGLAVESWEDDRNPTLNGAPFRLEPLETSRALAIAPDGERFVLGTDWTLRAFDKSGKERWKLDPPSVAWAVNITGDGRLVVAAFGDGTIRWYRLTDKKELLAFYPDGDRERWVAWTPEGYYMASPGGEDLIGWQINRGFDEAPEFYTASRFRDQFHRPDIIALVLEELDVAKGHSTGEPGGWSFVSRRACLRRR